MAEGVGGPSPEARAGRSGLFRREGRRLVGLGYFAVDRRRVVPDHPRPKAMVQATGGGRGVSAMGQMPHVHGNPTGGAGVRSWERRDSLIGHMEEPAGRPRGVTVPSGNRKRCLGPTPLMHTPTSPKPSVGIPLDPPYLTCHRSDGIYDSDLDGTSDGAARAAVISVFVRFTSCFLSLLAGGGYAGAGVPPAPSFGWKGGPERSPPFGSRRWERRGLLLDRVERANCGFRPAIV